MTAEIYQIVGLSLYVSFSSTIYSTVLGVPLGILLGIKEFRGKRIVSRGYLTRRLVDVSQDVIVREEDCGTTRGYEVTAINEHGEVIEDLAERIEGRYAFEDVVHPETAAEVLRRERALVCSFF